MTEKVKYMRLYNGVEYTYSQFIKFYQENDIQRHFIIWENPKQNSIS